jgi:putative phosphonate metabolism protein
MSLLWLPQMTERFALFFAPPITSALWKRAAQWLGRDAATGKAAIAAIPGIDRERLDALTGSARRYGFHATLKAPMALADGTTRAELEQRLAAFVLRQPQLAIGRLRLTLLDGFLALVPERQSEALTAFAASCVSEFDDLRAPLDATARDRRTRAGKLTPYQIGLLDHYGYPYVMDEFRFHMTLSDRLAAADREAATAAAEAWFASFVGSELVLDRLCLFHEAEAGAPFRRVADYPLTVEVTV